MTSFKSPYCRQGQIGRVVNAKLKIKLYSVGSVYIVKDCGGGRGMMKTIP